MAAAYEIEATLRIIDEASPKLSKVLGLVGDLTDAFERLQLAAKETFGSSFGGLGRGLNSAAAGAARLQRSLMEISRERVRPRIDLRSAEASIARLKGELTMLSMPARATGVPEAAHTVSPAELTAMEGSLPGVNRIARTKEARAAASLSNDQMRVHQIHLRANQQEERERLAAERNNIKAAQLATAQVEEEKAARVSAEDYVFHLRMRHTREEFAAETEAIRVAGERRAAAAEKFKTMIFGERGGGISREARHYAGLGLIGLPIAGAYEQAHLLREVNSILLASNEPMNSPMRGQVSGLIQQISSNTGMSYADAGEALKNTVLGFAGTPGMSFQNRLGFSASRATYAMMEHLMKPEISLQEAEKSATGLTHMAGAYSAKNMERIQADIAAISTLTPDTLRQVERAASYSADMGYLAGIPPELMFAVIAANQKTGTTSTKSGTWFADLITTGLNPKGGLAALVSTGAGKRRAAMLRQLGLLDAHGNFTGMKYLEEGRLDLLGALVQSHIHGMKPEELTGDFAVAAGGTQAGRALAKFANPNWVAIAQAGIKMQHQFLRGGAQAALNDFAAHDPQMQLQRTMRDFTNVLADLGSKVLRPLTSVLQGLDNTLKALAPRLPGEPGKSITASDLAKTGGVLGGGLGLMMGGPGGALIGASIGAGLGYATGAGMEAARQQVKNGVFVDPNTGIAVDLRQQARDAARENGPDYKKLADSIASAVRSALAGIAIVIDGKQMSSVVAGHAGHEASRPPSDSSNFDSRLSPLYPVFSMPY